jgi:hypothetical protein
MPVTNYKVWGWGTPVGIGVTGACHVGVAGVAKKATPQDPLLIANEVVCNSLARQLLLPCPPGATLDKNGEPYFFSLNFNLAGMALPPADPATIATALPRLSWGIILFDCLVMNMDRHDRNIAHDTQTNKVQIFDHGHAFLRAGNSDISNTLSSSDGQLCIGGHCLAAEICEKDGKDIWADRIKMIPDFFIEGIIEAATSVGLPKDKKSDCVDFLKKRRSEVGDIIDSNIHMFQKLSKAAA